ncbi:hypothetical protein TRFO_01514 [Tritrichomonas foetus]|uniref:Uncharacterized protein n=1 Tax=Tritrichomonas foetus TaxID=1144522 RepID=A0A1J4JXD9_9EUKA|nr:hypothetical protein TRFO_01514 [Tritrichomonas foetus]|eukprot:OHT03817.1 hypothetical protein TRFO_01514 [Tritrichomonas foetus]
MEEKGEVSENDDIIFTNEPDDELAKLTKNLSEQLQPSSENSQMNNLPPISNSPKKSKTLAISLPELSESSSPPRSPLSYVFGNSVNIQPLLITSVKSPLAEKSDTDNPGNFSDSNDRNFNDNKNNHYNNKANSKNSRNKSRSQPVRPVPPIDTHFVDQEEIKFALDRLIKKGIIPEYQIRNDVISLARRDTVIAMLNEDYDRADALENAIAILAQSIKADSSLMEDKTSTETIKNRLDLAKASQKQIEAHWNEIIEQQKEIERLRRETLQQSQESDIRSFKEKWEQPEAMIPFTKPSVELLQIRQQQKAYAIAHKFIDAKAMKIKADKLQKIETEIARKRAAQVMKAEYEQILEKHRKEVEAGEMNWARKLETLEMEKQAALKVND